MTAILEPRHPRKFNAVGLRLAAAVAFILYSITVAAQVFPPPSTSYGIRPPRGAFDSTLYEPTGCGVPTDSTFLFSRGFGQGEKLKLGAKYYDSCGHHEYVWDPALSNWHMVDSSSGGSADTTSLSSRINLKLDSVRRKPGTDTVYGYVNGIKVFQFKDTATLTTILASLGYAPLAPTDTVNLHNTVALKKNNNDSIGATGYASVGNLDRIRDSLLNLLAQKMINFGGAPGWLVGTYSGIPTASTYAAGTHYTAKDSGFIYIDTGSGGTAGWKKISGGGSSGNYVTNFLNSQQLGYGSYASKPITGTGFYYASDSSSWFYINGATATNITNFSLWARQGISPLGTHGDSLQLGGVLGTFFQNDTLYTAGWPFFITGLPSKASTLATDSINVTDIHGQQWKAPIPAGGGGTGDTSVVYASHYATAGATTDATAGLQAMWNYAAAHAKNIIVDGAFVDSSELDAPTTGSLSVSWKFTPGSKISYASKTGAALKWSGAAYHDIVIDNPQIYMINDTTSIGNNGLFFQSVTASTTIRRVRIIGGVLSGGQMILGKGLQGLEVTGTHFLAPLGHDNFTTTTNPAAFIRAIDDSIGDENKNWHIHHVFFDGFSQQSSVAPTSLKTGGRADGGYYGHVSGLIFDHNTMKHFDQECLLYQPGIAFLDSARTFIDGNDMDCSILPGSKAQGVAITSVSGIRAEGQRLTIHGNQIHNATVGVQSYATSAWNYSFRDLVVDGNTITASQDTASVPVKGIQIQGYSATVPSLGAVVKDNVIIIDSIKTKGATYQAIGATYYDSSIFANNIVKQGRLTRSGGGVWGIYTNTDTGLVMRNNTMQNVDTAGVFQSSTVDSGKTASALPGESAATTSAALFSNGTSGQEYWLDPRQRDTFYFVDDGQSNDYGNADAGYIGDTLSVSNLQVADTVTGGWKAAHAGSYPFNLQSPTQYSLCHMYYFARKIAMETGKVVRFLHIGHNGLGISNWYTSGASQPMLDTLVNRINRFIPSGYRIILFDWDQGESDNATVPSVYTAAWDSVKANLHRRCPSFALSTMIAVVGMPQVVLGAPTGYQGMDPTLQTRDYNWDTRDAYINTDSAYINTTTASNPLHFNADGLKYIGETGIYNFYKGLPLNCTRNNPGSVLPGSSLYPGAIHVRYSEAPGGGALYEGIDIMNRTANGRTGIKLLSSDSSSTIAYFGLAGPTGSYLQSNSMVLGTETNSNIQITRNFGSHMRFTGSGDSLDAAAIYDPIGGANFKFVNTTSTGGPALAFTGDASNTAQFGVGNSGSTTVPNSFYGFAQGTYKLYMTSGGTTISDTAIAPPSAINVNTLDVNGSFGLRIDSITGKVLLNKHNNLVFCKTGSGVDTIILPASTGCFNRIYEILKTDTGSSGTVKITLTSGSDFINRVGTTYTLTSSSPHVRLISNGVNGYYVLGAPPSSAGTNYQTVQSATVGQTQRPNLNFTSDFTVADNGGNTSTDISISTSKLNSGIYLPVLSNATNTSSTSADSAVWSRVGNVVTVSGKIFATPSSNNANIQIDISPPIASLLNGGHACWGTANMTAANGNSGVILADATNHSPILAYTSGAAASGVLTGIIYTYQYQIQ